MARRTPFLASVVAVAALLSVAGLVGSADKEKEKRQQLGIRGKVVDIGFGNGIGVDEVRRGGPAAGMGVKVGSFILRFLGIGWPGG
jgi:S1-C subfamily serine protease